jgi:NAD(P)-dependent dehydrogenase (short-subunit alcohol dehydrogenase family)
VAHTRTALVTGGSRGIGYLVGRQLARQGARVIVHAPTPAEAHAAVNRLIRDGADPGLLQPAAADYRRLGDVKSLARHLDRQGEQLDLLINNAGVAAPEGRTVDGFPAAFQINYLAQYVLTRLLGRALNAAGGRIVTVVSALHRDGHIDPDDPGRAAGAPPAEAYANAQLALMLFTRGLAQTDERRITSVAVHPGHVDTDGGLPVADRAAHVLHAADPAVDVVNGGYYEGPMLTVPAPAARDATAALRLWRATERLLGWDYTARRTATRSRDSAA